MLDYPSTTPAEHTSKAGAYARTVIDLVDKILRLKAQNDTKAQRYPSILAS